MNEGQTIGEGRAMRFRTTRWDLVFNSGDVDSPQHCKALADFCSLYWYPIYSFARYKGFSEDDAEDLTQSFFLHLLEKTALKRAQPHTGRFRSFLLASFQNHISLYRQHTLAAKRGGDHALISLDIQLADERYGIKAADALTAEKFFDAQWAKFLVERVMMQLSEEYRSHGKGPLFARLRVHLDLAGSGDGYQETAQEFGLSLSRVKTLVFRMRRRFATLLRKEVAQTVMDPAEIDAEIHALYEALVASEGRLEK